MRAGRLELLARVLQLARASATSSPGLPGPDLTPGRPTCQGIEEQHMTVEAVALDDVPGLIRAGGDRRRQVDHRPQPDLVPGRGRSGRAQCGLTPRVGMLRMTFGLHSVDGC